jgi:hypothetical protein
VGARRAQDECAAQANGEVVWSWLLDAEVKPAMIFHAGDGDKKPIIEESTKQPLKPFARGMSECSTYLW